MPKAGADYLGRSPSTVPADASLADDLNSFCGHFNASNNRTVAEVSSIARDEHTLRGRARHEERCRKAAGPDSIYG